MHGLRPVHYSFNQFQFQFKVFKCSSRSRCESVHWWSGRCTTGAGKRCRIISALPYGPVHYCQCACALTGTARCASGLGWSGRRRRDLSLGKQTCSKAQFDQSDPQRPSAEGFKKRTRSISHYILHYADVMRENAQVEGQRNSDSGHCSASFGLVRLPIR